MNIDFLETFITLSKTGSFVKTSINQHLSQSSVSNRIIELEKEFGCKLFERKNNRMVLTYDGQKLIPYAEEMIYLRNETKDALTKIPPQSNSISIGTVHAFYDNYFSNEIVGLQREFPNCTINVFLKHSREVMQGILSGLYSIGFSHHPCNYKNFSSKKIASEKLYLIGGNRKYKSPIYISQLKKLPYIHSNFLDRHIEELILSETPCSISVDIGSKIIPLISGTDYCTLLPQSYLETIDSKKYHKIEIIDYEFPPLEYYIIYRKDRNKMTPLELSLMDRFI